MLPFSSIAFEGLSNEQFGMTRQKSNAVRVDARKVNAAAVRLLPAIVKRWLPDGALQGRFWIAKNPHLLGPTERTLQVDLRKGSWTDFFTGDSGDDVISLAAFMATISGEAAAENLARMLRLR